MVENWVGGGNYITVKNTENVIAVPYDLPILGYGSDVVDRLRTWSAVLPQNFNLEKFSAGDYNGSRTAIPSRRRFGFIGGQHL